jgi:O-antigen/teichoic acid export membrane protein
MEQPVIVETAAPGLRSWYARNRTQARVLGGSLIMLLGSALVSILNFAYNVAVARMLGPGGFGDAAVAITLLMFVSAVTLSFQLVCAKLVARSQTTAEKAAVYRRLLRRAWLVGLSIGVGLVLASGVVARYLNMPDSAMVLVLAAGFALYVPVGARRGGMQGMCAFRRLAGSYVLEAVVKFAAAVALVEMGLGAMGAIIAITASIVTATLLPPVPAELKTRPAARAAASWHEGVQAVVFFVGQVVISNTDIVLVKHFFAPEAAGLYAAVALVGRVVYFASWMVVSAMFPISAGARETHDRKGILAVPLFFVVCLTGGFIAVLSLFPDLVLHLVFGRMFVAGGGLHSLLALYAATAGVYSLSVVLITYEMSRRIANTGWFQLAFSAAIVTGIYLYHGTLREVILVQLLFMFGLLLTVALPFLRRRISAPALQEAA